MLQQVVHMVTSRTWRR